MDISFVVCGIHSQLAYSARLGAPPGCGSRLEFTTRRFQALPRMTPPHGASAANPIGEPRDAGSTVPPMSDGHREFWRAQLASHLSGLFAATDPAALAEIEADAEWVSLAGGETLFRRGDPGDAAYIVISGRMRVVDDSARDRTLSEIGAGESLVRWRFSPVSGARPRPTPCAIRCWRGSPPRLSIAWWSGTRACCDGSPASWSSGWDGRARPQWARRPG